MSGTNKAILSISVLLLAALVVYYGMTPPESAVAESVDLPVQKSLVFGGDSGKLLDDFMSLETTGSAPQTTEEESNGYSIPNDTEIAGQLTHATDPITVDVLAAIVEPTYEEYTVLDGDSLSRIGEKKFGDGSDGMVRKIAALNNLVEPYTIYEKQKIRIPLMSTAAIPEGSIPAGLVRTIVTVVKNDITTYNCWSIAKKHLMTKGNANPSQKDIGNLVKRIQKENPSIKDWKILNFGDKIAIPKR